MTTLNKKNTADAYKWFLKAGLKIGPMGGLIKTQYRKDETRMSMDVSFLEFLRRYVSV